MHPGGMAEEVARAYPQVFVVDSQVNYSSLPGRRTRRWRWLLFLLLGLALFGVVVEGCLIYYLYNRTEVGTVIAQKGPVETNEISPMPVRKPADLAGRRQRPAAHLTVSVLDPMGKDGVMQWEHNNGDVILNNMEYNNGGLCVKKEGYYYLYSKVILNTTAECTVVWHKVMKNISTYGNPLEVMKSHKLRCHTQKTSGAKDRMASAMVDMWNSFLGGVFYLRPGDAIFVQLEGWKKARLERKENYMGAFMI